MVSLVSLTNLQCIHFCCHISLKRRGYTLILKTGLNDVIDYNQIILNRDKEKLLEQPVVENLTIKTSLQGHNEGSNLECYGYRKALLHKRSSLRFFQSDLSWRALDLTLFKSSIIQFQLQDLDDMFFIFFLQHIRQNYTLYQLYFIFFLYNSDC